MNRRKKNVHLSIGTAEHTEIVHTTICAEVRASTLDTVAVTIPYHVKEQVTERVLQRLRREYASASVSYDVDGTHFIITGNPSALEASRRAHILLYVGDIELQLHQKSVARGKVGVLTHAPYAMLQEILNILTQNGWKRFELHSYESQLPEHQQIYAEFLRTPRPQPYMLGSDRGTPAPAYVLFLFQRA